MNNKESMIKAQKYADTIKARLDAPVPTKHASSEDTYREFLNRELKSAQRKIDSLKLEGTAK